MEWNKDKKVDFKYLFTIPNILSYIRIVLIVPFMVFFIRKEYLIATIVIGISGLSDCFDGFLARKLNQVTQLGKMLDPVADKLTLLAVSVCLSIIQPVIFPVVIILVIKDILMLIGATVLLKKRIMPVASAWYGKVGTICFYFSVTVVVLFDIIWNIENFWIVSFVMLLITAGIMIYSLLRYYSIFRTLLQEHKESNQK